MKRLSNLSRRLLLPAAFSLWSLAAIADHYTVPLLLSAGTSADPQGVLRIVNVATSPGAVEIYAIDDSGTRSGPATFSLDALSAVEFTATDLQSGNSTLGLTGGIGADVGDARLEIETDLQIVPLAFVRAADGLLSAMHDTVRAATTDRSGQYEYNVPIFNLSTEMTQTSRLRLINPGDGEAAITITGIDDTDMDVSRGDVTLTLAAGGATTLTAQQLEAGDTNITGLLGAGVGRWRLTVSSDRPLRVVNTVVSTGGHWSNLSTHAVQDSAPTDQMEFDARFADERVTTESGTGHDELQFANGSQFTGTAEVLGITFTRAGSYDYRSAGPDTGRLTLVDELGEVCETILYFSSRISGWFASHCTGSDSADGRWSGGRWFVGDGGGRIEGTSAVGDMLAGVPTSGVFDVARSGGGVNITTGPDGTTITMQEGGYFELNDGTRYSCTSSQGCEVVDGAVTRGTVARRTIDRHLDRFPSFRTVIAPENQTYTVGTAIVALSLPAATGGNGTLSYTLTPIVAGLSFNAGTRRLTGRPSLAGTYTMTYTVMDEDGDSDSITFDIIVNDADVGMITTRGFHFTSANGNGDPGGLAFADDRVYVLDWTDRLVHLYSANSGQRVMPFFRLTSDNRDPTGITHANGRIYVVDSRDRKVYAYSLEGQRALEFEFDLDDDNGNANGITYADGRFYVVDDFDDRVYAYSLEGQREFGFEFGLDDDNSNPGGITYADGRFYVVDGSENWVYAYSTEGQRLETYEFYMVRLQRTLTGMTYADGRFYVVDSRDDRIYAYTDNGLRDLAGDIDLDVYRFGNNSAFGITYADGRLYLAGRIAHLLGIAEYSATTGLQSKGSLFLTDPDNSQISGIAYADSRLYVADWVDERVYAYSESTGQQVQASGFDLVVDNRDSTGITYADGRFYVVDSRNDRVYAYSVEGQRVEASEFDLDGNNGDPTGITYADGRFYVVDWRDARVYAYSVDGQRVEASEFALDDDNGDARGITYADGTFFVTDDTWDWVFAYSPED